MPGIALFVLIGAGGCGLSDYQSRMDAQRLRVEEFDECNRLLDDPIDMPRIQFRDAKENTESERAAWDFEIFLRLPQGYGATVKEKIAFPDNFAVFRYAGGSEGASNIFVAAARVAEPEKKEPEFGKYTTEVFLSYVKPALEDYYRRNFKAQVFPQQKSNEAAKEVKAVAAYPDPTGPGKISYTNFTYADEGNAQVKDRHAFDVYLHKRAGKQVCIVFQRPLQPANAAKLRTSIEACLGSLDVTLEAATKRAEYRKAKGL
jgi:hypothetical protein